MREEQDFLGFLFWYALVTSDPDLTKYPNIQEPRESKAQN